MPETSISILIVDDEPAVLDTYRTYLDQVPYRFLLTNSGTRAIEIVKRELDNKRPIAAGFFDLKMPDIDGLETICRIRELDNRLLSTIVTAYDDHSIDEINRRFRNGYADKWDYLSKPFTRNELCQKAHQLIASWNRQREQEQRTDLDQLLNCLAQLRNLRTSTLADISRATLRQLTECTDSAGGCLLVSVADNLRFVAGVGALSTEAHAQEDMSH